MLIDKVLAWQRARRNLLDALAERDSYMKAKGKLTEVVEPTPLMPLWEELSRAESALYQYDSPIGDCQC